MRLPDPHEARGLPGYKVPARDQPGRQHELDAEYFDRIDAMNYALVHDDGQSAGNLPEARISGGPAEN